MSSRSRIAILLVVPLLAVGLVAPAAGAVDDPVVTITPSTDLLDGSVVHVTVAGALARAELFAQVCAVGTNGFAQCDPVTNRGFTTDESGSIEYDLGVEAAFDATPGITVDCRVSPGCELLTLAQRTDGSIANLHTPLAFRPDGPLLPGPTMTVEPATDLVDGQHVRVTGSGFVPGTAVELAECKDGATTGEGCESSRTFVGIEADGAIDVDLQVYAISRTNFGDELDCRSVACTLVASRGLFQTDTRHTAVAPLAFRPGGPLLPPPTITVTPATGLVNGQVVTVTGAGFRPESSFALSECGVGPGDGFDRCFVPQFVSADAEGKFTRTMPVQSITRRGSGFVDCRLGPNCVIAAVDVNSGPVLAEAPIAFDPGSPSPPVPTVAVAPSGALADRSPVVVTGKGFPASYPLDIKQCRLEAGLPTECADGSQSAQSDGSGAFVAGVVAMPVIAGPGGTEIDCRTKTCGLTVASLGSLPGVAPLTFAPAQTGPPRRYLAPVFDDVDVTEGVVYRQTTTSRGTPIDLALDIYRPAGDSATKRPAIVWMFGGYFGSGDRKQLRDLASAMARRGYVSVAIDYRTRPDIFGGGNGCVNVGGTCLDPSQLGPAIVDARDDARAAMAWLHDHAAEYGIEPRAISAAGWSAGAVTALNLAHDHTGDRPAASVPAAAISLSGILTAVPQAGDPPTLMLGGNHDSLLAMKAQIAGCGLIVMKGASCRFVAYSGLEPDPAVDDCVQFKVPCTYVLGRDAEHGFFFTELPDVADRISGFLVRSVLQPLGLVPRGRSPHHHRRDDGHDRHHHHDRGSRLLSRR